MCQSSLPQFPGCCLVASVGTFRFKLQVFKDRIRERPVETIFGNGPSDNNARQSRKSLKVGEQGLHLRHGEKSQVKPEVRLPICQVSQE